MKNINSSTYDESNKCPKCRGFISYTIPDKDEVERIKCDCCNLNVTIEEFNKLWNKMTLTIQSQEKVKN